MDEPFTLSELRAVYETVWGVELDAANVRRKVLGTPGFVTADGGAAASGGGRPAALYRKGSSVLLHPAMMRAG